MRLSQLLEYRGVQRGNRTQTVTVPVHREVETSPDQWDEVVLQATFSCGVEIDPYATGDSPDQYNIELVSVVGPDGKELGGDALSDEELDNAKYAAQQQVE